LPSRDFHPTREKKLTNAELAWRTNDCVTCEPTLPLNDCKPEPTLALNAPIPRAEGESVFTRGCAATTDFRHDFVIQRIYALQQ